MLTFLVAPRFAQQGTPASDQEGVGPGTWKPEPKALEDFATAVATRYSGTFERLAPRGRSIEPWNEPNINYYMAPQYEGNRLVSVDRYRKMVRGVDRAVDSVHPDNRIVVGGTAPYGEEPGGSRTRPLVVPSQAALSQRSN